MNPFYIILIAHNEAEYVKLSLQSIRMFADVDSLSVVIVDNHSTDTLRDWAAVQEDITYVYMDEGMLPFGMALHQVIKELHIEGNLCLMEGGTMLTPGCLSGMLEILHEDSHTGAVAPVKHREIHPVPYSGRDCGL